MKSKIMSRVDDVSTLLEIIHNRDKYKENSENGLVILLNGEWGTGKTTFIEEFVDRINAIDDINLFNVYNAYENDYYENAYIPFFASIDDKLKLGKEFGNFIKSLGRTATNSVVTVSYAITKSLFKTKYKIDLDDINNNMKDIQDEQNIDYLKNYKDFSKYKNKIKEKMKKICEDTPMVFIIDELDRCKPSFAIDTLEIVKHFFDVDNCIFVISVDKIQLASSVKAIYGASMNGEQYFSKLFDYQYNLLPINFYDSIDLTNEKNIELIEWSTKIFNILNISLRDSKKIFNELTQKNENWTIEQSLFILFLITLKYTDLLFYKIIINGEYRKYKKILDSGYNRELEKYNKLLNFKIGGCIYKEILAEVEMCFNREYSSLGKNPDKASTSVADRLKSYEEIENDVLKFVPEINIVWTIKDIIKYIVN